MRRSCTISDIQLVCRKSRHGSVFNIPTDTDSTAGTSKCS